MDRMVEIVLSFLLNAVWQIALITLIAAACSRLLSPAPARLRHALWVAALLLCVALPLASLFDTAEAELSRSEIQAIERPAKEQSYSPAPHSQSIEAAHSVNSRNEAGSTNGFGFQNLLRRRRQTITNAPVLASTLALCYALFLFYRSTVLWRAWRRVQSLRRSAHAGELPAQLRAVARYCQAFGLKRLSIKFSPAALTPATLGAREPLIILPMDFGARLSPEALTSVVGHEAAHVARRDFALNLVYEFLFLPISFHPFARLIKRQIERTREMACDEMVAERLLAPEVYARSLVHVASALAARGERTLTLGVFDADILEERIMRLTRHTRRIGTRAVRLLALTTFSALGLSCFVISTFSFELRASGAAALLNDTTQAVATGEPRDGGSPQSQQGETSRQEERSSQPARREVGPQSLNSDSPQARAQGACEAGHKRAVEMIPALVVMLGDDAPILAQRCWENDRWSPALDSFKQPSPGEQAAIALASMGTPAVEPLTKALDSTDTSARRNAAWAIGELTNMRGGERANAVPGLVSLLGDADEWVRAAAARALGEIRDGRAAGKLIDSLSDGDARVRETAAWALSEMKEEGAVDKLCRLLISDAQAEVRRMAAEALGEIKSQRAVSSLKQALNDPEPLVRAEASRAIAEIEDSAG